jgi:hypothetical protein
VNDSSDPEPTARASSKNADLGSRGGNVSVADTRDGAWSARPQVGACSTSLLMSDDPLGV